jgi:transcription initiation factor TFIIH subunit 2
VERFVREYFDQNPISQLGLIGTRGGRADRISDLSGNVGQHVEALRDAVTLKTLAGQPSIQNAIELARQILRYV